MKRRLLVGALACASSAFAQTPSTVTIYGIVDSGVEHITNVNGGSLTRIPTLTGSVPSRLGFRGSEDLGGGLRAQFVLEQGIGVDTGVLNQGGRAWGRQALVGLSAPWGTATLGRQYTMFFWSLTSSDVLGPNNYGLAGLDSYIPNARVDNSLSYLGKIGGFTGGATYSLGRDAVNAGPSPAGTNCAGENGADTKACREWSLLAKYDTPVWGAAAAVDRQTGGPGAFAGLTNSSLTDTRSTLNGYFNIAQFKIAGGLIHRKNEGSLTTPKSDLWFLGGVYKFTPLITVDAQYSQIKFDNSANKARQFVVRGTYGLSKRTALYVTGGHLKNNGALALSISTGATGSAPPVGGSQSAVMAGIRHEF